jgi:hypothetical protein
VSGGAKTAAPRPLAVCRSYDDLRRAIAAFCADQGITRQDLDADAGLTDGHAGKLLAPRTLRRAIKRFGDVSFGRVLDALDLEIVLQVRADAAERTKPPSDALGDACSEQPHPQDWRRKRGTGWARRMAARRALLLPPKRRKEIARKAALARWQRRNASTPGSKTPPA